MFYNITAVFLGGGLGAVTRYAVSHLCKNIFHLPLLGTLAVNLAGCFLIGYTFGLTLGKIQTISPLLRLFVTVGFLGGLTTFSTLSLEGFELIRDGKIVAATLYIAGSAIIGLLFVFAGYSLSKP